MCVCMYIHYITQSIPISNQNRSVFYLESVRKLCVYH